MSSIAEKLAAAKQAAVASSGLPGTAAAAAPVSSASVTKDPNPAVVDPTVYPASTPPPLKPQPSASVLKPEDLIPKRTSKDEVLFKSVKANLGFIIAPNHKQTIRGRFSNHYLLTKDPVVIAYVRENAKAFDVVEVGSTPPKAEETKTDTEKK